MASGLAMSPAGKLVILAVTATVNMQAHHHRGNRKTSRRHVSTAKPRRSAGKLIIIAVALMVTTPARHPQSSLNRYHAGS